MDRLANGHFVGSNLYTLRLNGVVLSENVYPTNYSSRWHCHETSFFTLILKGGSREIRKNAEIACTPGTVLYYHQQEPHRNNLYQRGSRNFSVELEATWFNELQITGRVRKGFQIGNPSIKSILIRMMAEARVDSAERQLNLESMAAQLTGSFTVPSRHLRRPPQWLRQIKDCLGSDLDQPPTLKQLSGAFGIHPVTISKLFPLFFHCTMGTYIRQQKIQSAFRLLAQRHISLQEVAAQTGFSDHAHFSRLFKRYTSITPTHYRKLLFG